MDVHEWVRCSVKQNASDLHLCSGHPPVQRIDGVLRMDNSMPNLRSDQLECWCERWLEPAHQQQLQQCGQVDCALTLPEGQRLRVNLFMQRHGLSIALRLIPASHPSLSALKTPPIVSELAERPDGLVLVTGATGSGKSTTLAAMIDALNQRCSRHIITLEDPIEFLHTSQQCLIQQREIGRHSESFNAALRAALREDPDVLLLGELRDAETIRLALTAAETGHLVLATLHTRSAVQAVERLVDVFPADEKAFVRTQLAASLQAVVAQKLMPGVGGGRIALFEILMVTPAASNLIREGKTHQLPSLLQTGGQLGMQTFEQSRQQRCREGEL
ncbi:type IV pilus twitching motility protein PilT [Pectobacteriaceae bacterium CE90]|nr:type IV pilus twitching motility protein PilT [Pectobacteriaceae bacterium CE90]